VLCSRAWVFISQVMQVTSVWCAALCVRSVDSPANTMFSKNIFHYCSLFAMFTATLCQSVRLLVVRVVTIFYLRNLIGFCKILCTVHLICVISLTDLSVLLVKQCWIHSSNYCYRFGTFIEVRDNTIYWSKI
jgi:hypothetical protein